MRTINRSTAFKRDYKRIKATPQHKKDIDSLIEAVLVLLLTDQVLPPPLRDHALTGDWVDVGFLHVVRRNVRKHPSPGHSREGREYFLLNHFFNSCAACSMR